MLDTTSLAATVDAVNEAIFFRRPIQSDTRTAVARWIASRQGLPGSYASMFAATEQDFRNGVKLFTGEAVRCAALRHTLGEEACRALLLLSVRDQAVRAALEAASRNIEPRIDRSGWFCCGKCSAAVWRHINAGGLSHGRQRLTGGMKILKEHRKGDGAWRRFPFYYTLLALEEIDLPAAVSEMKYAAARLERVAKRAAADKYALRRQELAKRILAKV